MGTTKSAQFSTSQNEQADWFKALGHPALIAIIEILLKSDACVCGDLVHELPLSQSTVSQHLAELKKVGLIKGTISGPNTCYCINKERLDSAKNKLNALLGSSLSSVC